MEMPEELRELVDSLGQALFVALSVDPNCRELAHKIQEHGYEIGLMIEATVALHRLEGEEEGESRDGIRPADESAQDPVWSEEDKAFLKKFKISIE